MKMLHGSVSWVVLILLSASCLIWPARTYAGQPPPHESACADLSGAAFGLCNAFCNAQHCDVEPQPSCEVLRQNFERQTGSSTFPCEVARTATPTQTGIPTGTVSATLTPTATAPPPTGTATATGVPTGTATGIIGGM